MDTRKVIDECKSEIQAASEDGNEYDEGDGGHGLKLYVSILSHVCPVPGLSSCNV